MTVGINGEYRRMRRDVQAFYPELNEKQVAHLCNLVGNELRTLKCDILQVDIQPYPFKYEPGFYSKFVIEHRFNQHHWLCAFLGPIKTYRVYVRVTID